MRYEVTLSVVGDVGRVLVRREVLTLHLLLFSFLEHNQKDSVQEEKS